MFDQYRFSLLPFPQRQRQNELDLHVLIIPQISLQWNGDPLLETPIPPPGSNPDHWAFATSKIGFEARVLDSLDDFPAQALPATIKSLGGAAALPKAKALFEELKVKFKIKNTVAVSDLSEKVDSKRYIKKYLTRTYRNAFHFTSPRVREAVVDDSYHCAVKEHKQANPNFKQTSDEMTWGKAYAFALRHPYLAEQLGLIRKFTIELDPGMYENGGFLYVTFGPDSAYRNGLAADGQFEFVRHYACRIPALDQTEERPLFAPVLFPVLYNMVAPDGNYDQAFIEAAEYDDGFAKIVHASQPCSQNLLAEEEDGAPPQHDLGIRLGWDDEQVLIWQNRQLKEQEEQPGSGKKLDAPMGVFGYRVDARLHDDAGTAPWTSLVRVQSKKSLTVGSVDVTDGQYEGELQVEVHPMQLDGDPATHQFWLPMYFGSWNGKSMVLPDEDAVRIFQLDKADSQQIALGRIYNALGIEAGLIDETDPNDREPLQYGKTYDFRVRLVDPTGGGPEEANDPVHEAEAPVTTFTFKRYVKPEPVRMEGLLDFLSQQATPEGEETAPEIVFFPGSPANTLTLRRPLLGYPNVVYTGKYDDPIPLLQAASDAAQAIAQANLAKAPGEPYEPGHNHFGIADPDVTQVQITVEVRTLKLDNLSSVRGDEHYLHFYTTTRDFPAGMAQIDDPLDLPLEFRDAPVLKFGDQTDLGNWIDEATELNSGSLKLPTARDIRLTIRALAPADNTYFGGTDTHEGRTIQIKVRQESSDERELLKELSPSREVRGIYLQPDPPQPNDRRFQTLLFKRGSATTPALIQRLAAQLEVEHKGLTLVGEKGQRVVFGCSRRIRHTLAPDHSSITFASKDELLNHWIVAVTLQIDRDWTWDNLQEVSFEIYRRKLFGSIEELEGATPELIGDLEVKSTAPINALQNPDRSHTTLIYLDAVEPKPETLGEFPNTIALQYRIDTKFRNAPDQEDAPKLLAPLELPVTTTPAQMPKIVSAGIALSPYRRDEAYSSTEARERYLWLELEDPIDDPNDAYFIRLLGYGPDPLLSDNRLETFIPPEEPALNIDPELIRVITPGQSDDNAGLSAMQPLEPATDSDRHFLVPLPPGLHAESDELFGFFTYELRVGHADIWSTAQGRYGRPLRSTGVQHPAPTLFCTCFRNEVDLRVEAPHAKAVLNGKNITSNPPRTEIWCLLYAQVKQADGKDYRNILLEDRKMTFVPRKKEKIVNVRGKVVTAKDKEDTPARSLTGWTDNEICQLLQSYGLPCDSNLSVLCVEMMPRLDNLQQSVAAALNQKSATAEQNLDLVGNVRAARGNATGAFQEGSFTATKVGLKPLSDQLGHYRILRTSPLVPVPEGC